MLFLSQNYITLSLIVAFVITFFTGPCVVKFCQKNLKVRDRTEKSIKDSIPTGGGIVFVAVISILLLLFTFTEFSDLYVSLFLLVMTICGIGVAVLGVLDDKFDLSPKLRIIIQSIAVVLPVALLPNIWPGVSEYIEKPILVLAWLWFLNLYNFIDGIDGYAAMESIVISIVGSFLVPVLAPLFMIVTFSMAGFLRINLPKPRAKVFMGDIGSTFLGYILAGLMFVSLTFDNSLVFAFFTIVMLFTCDATFTLIKRIIRGEKSLMSAHSEHWFSRLQNLGASHKKILLVGVLVNVLLTIIVVFTYNNEMKFISPIFGILVFSIFSYYVKYYEKKAGIKPLGFRKQK